MRSTNLGSRYFNDLLLQFFASTLRRLTGRSRFAAPQARDRRSAQCRLARKQTLGGRLRCLPVVLALLCLARPAAADFAAAQAAQQRGDYAAAFQACKADADTGDPRCQNDLGVLYERGLGIEKELAEAIRLYRLAAAQGLADAEENLAAAYQFGRGVSKDDAQAAYWYRLAAEQGAPAAQNNLAILYMMGQGVPRDPARALDLLRKAALRGHLSAIDNLAQALDQGVGAARDPLNAFLWYSIAARLSATPEAREKASEARDRLAAAISPVDLVAARQAAASWVPGNGDPQAGLAASGRRPTAMASGIVVSRDGNVVTNRHAVQDCREIKVLRHGKALPATRVAIDQGADLAVLWIPEHSAETAEFRGEGPIRPGESVAVVGYPLQGVLSSQPSITTGIVSAVAGPHDDQQLLQITAPVQPGNSGGPLLDQGGAVVGVVVGKLQATQAVNLAAEAPENVNFAVNAELARTLLDRAGIKYETLTANQTLSTPAIAERAFKFTVIVDCIK
jgi:TPR repeat protein